MTACKMKHARHQLTAAVVGLTTLVASSTAQTPIAPSTPAVFSQSVRADGEAPLPLRIPILAVMLGSMNRSASEIFKSATLLEKLSDEDWLKLGAAAVDLVGAATLITVRGTGDHDAEWVSDPRWTTFARDMQDASIAAGAATTRRDRAALSLEASRLAQSCQACHMTFSARLVNSPEAAPNQ